MANSPDHFRTSSCVGADSAQCAPPLQPDTQRRVICVARAPDEALIEEIRSAGWEVVLAKTAAGAEAATKKCGVAAGLIDFDGFTPRDFPTLKACLSQTTIGWVAITAEGKSASKAVRELIRNFCFDYVTLPLPAEWISHALGHARGMAALDYVDTATGALVTDDNTMVGTCEAMQQLFSTIRKVANTNASVFISGQSGTGKELTALAIHRCSPRRKAPFVAINCGAIPHHLLQSELFGYERGAFTGAHERRIGRIESANGGTLFLDEIGDTPLETQAGLLRFLQEGKIQRLGGNESIPVDIRIISATHVDLEAAILAGRFRADLFHRLCVLRVDEPPLSARGKDIEVLAYYVLQKYKADSTHKIHGFTPSAIDAMHKYHWPGNVRELINRVRRGLVMAEGRLLTARDLDLDLESQTAGRTATLDCIREQAERSVIETALLRHDYRLGETATALGISRGTLYRRMVAYGMHVAEDTDSDNTGAELDGDVPI
jgi:DNA-binding NtrC family response regulator